ncbi:MAG: sigma-70 family RNA polymerase sigma factor [Alphaproteobacteria bacterium]
MTELAAQDLERLIARVSLGDRDAFKRLYDSTSAKLFGVALRILRRRDRAEDVVQESYMRIWERAQSYAPEKGSPIGWMASIVRHRAIDRLRRQREHASLEESPEGARVADPAPDALEHAMRSAEARRLGACLEELGGKQRDCIVLAFYQGHTHEELAQRVDVPLGTVKSWIRRGLMSLKECLER